MLYLTKSIIRSKEARKEVIGFLSDITHISKREFKNALFVGGEIPPSLTLLEKRNFINADKIWLFL